MKTIRLICCALFVLWAIVPLLIFAALCCNEAEQTDIGNALFRIVKAIGGDQR